MARVGKKAGMIAGIAIAALALAAGIALAVYVDNNRHIINGVFDSMGYEEIKRFFYNDLFSVFYGAIEQGEEKLGVKVAPQFREFLATFYTEASAGLLIGWAKNRTEQDREVVLQNLLSIYKISIPAVLSEMRIQ